MNPRQLKTTSPMPDSGEKEGRPTAVGSSSRESPFLFAWSLDRSSDVGRALLAATRRLREAGSLPAAGAESAQLDSAVLMAHVLGVSKAWLYAYPNRPLTEDEISKFEALVRRRMRYEPVAYLVGFKPFFGLDITVDRRVLIPRPETELLVERVLGYLRVPHQPRTGPRVADIGTGSGAIAVSLAVNAPEALIYATDVSEEALAVAAQNVWRYGLGEQVQLLPGHLLEPLPEPVDVIVANLPYVATPTLAALPPQVRDFEPTVALDGGEDGLRVIAALFQALAAPDGGVGLRPGGRIYLEIGAGQGAAVRDLACAALPGAGRLPPAGVEVWEDYAGLDRIVVVSF